MIEKPKMNIEYTLRKKDIIIGNLYAFEKDGSLKEYIKRYRILWMVNLFCFEIIILLNYQDFEFAIVIAIIGILVIAVLPKRLRNSYALQLGIHSKKYERHLNIKRKLIINNKLIELITEREELKRKTTELDCIIETQEYFFIKCRPELITIPKSEFQNKVEIQQELIELTRTLKIPFNSELNWK